MNFCQSCETCSACLKKGCIPITPEEPVISQQRMGGMVLRHIRARHKTQKAAASFWGIHPTSLSKMISGKCRPSAIILQEIGIAPTVIYVRVENIEPQQKETDASSSA